MRINPIPDPAWVQALADGGQWLPAPQESHNYSWLDQLPRPMERAPTGRVVQPEGNQGIVMNDTPWLEPGNRSWTDLPDWLQALNDDQDYLNSRVIESPYGGWGGSYMQMRRRQLR